MAKSKSKFKSNSELRDKIRGLRKIGKIAEADELERQITSLIPEKKSPTFSSQLRAHDSVAVTTSQKPSNAPELHSIKSSSSKAIKPSKKNPRQDLVMYGFRIGKDDLQSLKNLSELEDRSVGSLIRKAIKQFLEEQ